MQIGRWSATILFVTMLVLFPFRLTLGAANGLPNGRPIGWVGISIQEVDEQLAERLAATFGIESGTGVLVVEAIRGGPGDAGGLKPNDVIVKLENQPIWEVRQLQKIIRQTPIGRPTRLTVLREKQRVLLSVTVAAMPEAMQAQLAGERLGFFARPRSRAGQEQETQEMTRRDGLTVMGVVPDSPAARAGLRPQVLLVGIGEHQIRSLEEMGQALRLAEAGGRLSIQVVRDGKRHILSLPVPPLDEQAGSRRD